MKKSVKALVAIMISVSLLLGTSMVSVGKEIADGKEKAAGFAAAQTLAEEAEETENLNKETKTGEEETQESVLAEDEVVYVFANAEGKVNKVTDSIWIEEDDESKHADAGNALPIDVSIKYSLDGKEVAPSELKGKDGHLEISVLFTDKQYETRMINGKEEKVYVPFIASAIMVLDDEKYENVSVSNGRVVFDGARYAVAGVALPGLKEDLDIGKDVAEIPEDITVSADVKDCDIPGMYLLVSNSIFSELTSDRTDDLETLQDDMNKINDAMDALINGSDELYDGLSKLLEGANRLEGGVNELTNGLDKLSANSGALNDGATQVFNTLLATASSQLAEAGINVNLTIDNYGSVLEGLVNDGYTRNVAYAQVESKVKENEGTIRNAVTDAVNEQVEAKVNEAARAQVEEKVTAAVREQVLPKVTEAVKAEVEAQVTDGVRDGVEAKVKPVVIKSVAESLGLTEEQALAVPQAVSAIEANTKAQVDAQMATDEVKALIKAKTEEQMASAKVKALIESKTDEQMATDPIKATVKSKTDEQMGTKEVKALIASNLEAQKGSAEVQGIIDQKTQETVVSKIEEYKASSEVQSKISEGDAKILALKASLDGYAEFYSGIRQYTNGVDMANTGAHKIKDSMPEFVKGIEALKEGEGQLSDGLNEFNDQGVMKLNDIVNGSLEGMVERLDAIKDVSGDYNAYSDEGTKNSVKFIYKIGSIE